jgi:hypothetical protein
VELNIESPGDRENAPERIFPTSCDKKWRIASFPFNNKTAMGFPVKSIWNTGEGAYREKQPLAEPQQLDALLYPGKR